MRLLRTLSTRRLLAGLAAAIVVIAAGTAIAVAAVGNGPVPKRRSLAAAIHGALGAKPVNGLSATISYTNNLIGSGELQGSDPLLSSATGRLWASGSRLRLELQSDNGDAQIVFDHGSFWAYDPAMNVVYRGKLPASGSSAHPGSHARGRETSRIPSVAEIQTDLDRLAAHVGISGADPTDVGGRPAYRVTVSPKTGGGLLGEVSLAWDASRGIPLKFAVYARGDSTPALELQATGVSYGRVPASVFEIQPPSGAKVVEVALPAISGASHAQAAAGHHRRGVSGLGAVRRRVSFSLAAPSRLAGRARNSVSLIGGAGHRGALLWYGSGLGGIAVVERAAGAGGSMLPRGGGGAGGEGGPVLMLPTVQIDGVTAEQLPTPLGTIVQFTRGGVSYVVIGSVTVNTADAAAREL
jgi:outer membrane lipoprotein-sorting protein